MLCEDHKEEYDAWLDYKLPPTLAIHTVGNSVRDVNDARNARFERWKNTVNFQQDLIKTICAKGTKCNA